jgi:hypothetical protein
MRYPSVVRAVAVGLLVSAAAPGWAWGKRGHEAVATVAARLLAVKRGNPVLRPYAYDLGYYANVPDNLWRNINEETSAVEGPQHFIDWSAPLAKAFGSPQNLPLTFADYKAGLGDAFAPSLGVVPYRIHDLAARCKTLADGFTRERHLPLLVCLGTLSHYTGDIGQPLHVTDDYDGKRAGQPGIHAWFETLLVDELDAPLAAEVLKRALQDFDRSPLRGLPSDQAVRSMIADSYSRIDEMLKIDRAVGRIDAARAGKKFRPLLVERLSRAAILTAVVWDEILGPLHSFGDKPLYGFDGCAAYLEPDPAFRAAVAAAPRR